MSRSFRPAESKAVRLDVDPELHATLEALAFVAGLPMSQYVRGVVQAHADAHRSTVEAVLQARAGALAPPDADGKAPARRKAPR